ncbi:MAG: c-type cytochrome [Nitrososphaerota archaeon]
MRRTKAALVAVTALFLLQSAGASQEQVGAEAAAALFKRRCTICHGQDGKGDKENAPKAPDFTDPKWQTRHKDGELYRAISEGIGKGKGSMPSWKTRLSEPEMKALVKHVRSLGKKQ